MKNRQKILLAILDSFSDPPTRTQLVKLLFLLRQKTDIQNKISFYDFLPYHFGPFSFTLYEDLDNLQRHGLLDPNSISITCGQKKTVRTLTKTLPKLILDNIAVILAEYGHFSSDRLVEKVYEDYPWYASRSQRKMQPKRIAAVPAIYTIGYEGKSIDAFLNELLLKGIERIIDVRNNPISRKYGFSKFALRNFLGKLDIEYVHLPELGIPSENRKPLVAIGDYHALFTEYEDDILPKQTDSLQQTTMLLQKKPSALMCFENDVRYCHRGRLAKYIARTTNLPSIHL